MTNVLSMDPGDRFRRLMESGLCARRRRAALCILGEVRGGLFQDVTLLGDTRQFFLGPPDPGLLISLTLRLRKLRHPCVKRFGADRQPLRHLLDRISTLSDLRYRVDLEII